MVSSFLQRFTAAGVEVPSSSSGYHPFSALAAHAPLPDLLCFTYGPFGELYATLQDLCALKWR